MNYSTIFLIVCSAWCLSEILLVIFRRSGATSKKRDSGSVVRLNLIIYGSVSLGVCVALTGIGVVTSAAKVLSWIGLCFIVAGLIIRWISIAKLWKYFTVDVAINSDHRLLSSGIYGIIRHPAYLGSILSFIGLGIALCNWIALLVIIIPVTRSFLERIVIEEKALIEAFGNEYVDYCKRTKCLIPFLF